MDRLLVPEDVEKFRKYSERYEVKGPQPIVHKRTHIKKKLLEIESNKGFKMHNHL